MEPELFRPVTTRAASEAVARQILELVEAGAIEEGDVLPGERVLADMMRVSRPTIRMAIAALAEGGLVEVKPGRQGGIELKTRWISEDLRSSITGIISPNAEQLFAVLEARRAVEPRVAQLAAMRGTVSQFDEMRRALELQERHMDDHPKAMQAELMFHRRIWQAAGNPELEQMLVRLFDSMATLLDMAIRTETDQHKAIELNHQTLDVIALGDTNAVERIMDEHMGYLERIVEESSGHRRIRPVPDFLVGEPPHGS